MFIVFTVFVLITNTFFAYIGSQPSLPSPAVVHTRPLFDQESPVVCPGETIRVHFVIEVDQPSVLEIEISAMRADTHETMFATLARRVIIPERLSVDIRQDWTIPTVFRNVNAGEAIAWKAGEHLMLLAVTTTSRNTEPEIISFPFQIGDSCGAPFESEDND